jgi:hypothetical protein
MFLWRLSRIKMYEFGEASNGVTFIQYFTKIGRLVQRLKGKTHIHTSFSDIISLFVDNGVLYRFNLVDHHLAMSLTDRPWHVEFLTPIRPLRTFLHPQKTHPNNAPLVVLWMTAPCWLAPAACAPNLSTWLALWQFVFTSRVCSTNEEDFACICLI